MFQKGWSDDRTADFMLIIKFLISTFVAARVIGACRPGPTRAMPGLLMHLWPLILAKIGYISIKNKVQWTNICLPRPDTR